MPDKFNCPTDPAGALYHAVTCGHVDLVERAIRETPELIRNQAVIDGAWSHGGRRCGAQDDVLTCLHLLIKHGARFESCHVQTLDSAFKTMPRAAALFLDHGANANAADSDGTTALHLMVAIGYRFAADVLLARGANINAQTSAGETPLDVAVAHEHTRMIHFLRDRDALANLTDREKDPFHEIYTDIVLRDDRRPAEINWYRADRGYGYLRDARGYGDLFFDADDIISKVPESIEQGVDVSFAVTHDKFGLRAVDVEFGPIRTGLHAYINQSDVLRKALADGADPNRRHATEGCTMLHNICYCRQKLRHPGRNDEQVIRDGLWNDEPWLTSLRVAIEAGNDVNAQTNIDVPQEAAEPWRYFGETPLHLAAASWARNLIQELLAAGADKSIKNAKEETPFDWAVKYQACEEIQALLKES